MTRRGLAPLVLVSLTAVVLALVLAPLFGTHSIDVGVALDQLWDPRSPDARVLADIRIPRVLAGLLVGGCLAAAGAALQALTRNGLASEYTLGVASGAALGAVTALRLGLAGSVLGLPMSSAAALCGAAVVATAVLGWARRGSLDPGGLLLAGVTIGMVCSAGILLVQYLADATQSHLIVRWLMGGLDVVGYGSILGVLPFAVTGVLLVGLHATELNQLLQGEEIAEARGVAVRTVRGAVLAGVALLSAAAVSIAGPVGFVGIIVPHTVRMLAGVDHRRLIPLAFVWGGVFLVACDAVARSLRPLSEVPVGILTAMIGGPFFLWVLAARRRRVMPL